MSTERGHAGTLILDFQLAVLWGNKFLLFQPSYLWYFILAPQVNLYMQEIEAEQYPIVLMQRNLNAFAGIVLPFTGFNNTVIVTILYYLVMVF